jgi:hypothetical protein
MNTPATHRPANHNRLAPQHRRKSKTAPGEQKFRTPRKSRSAQASAISNGRLLPSHVNGGVDGRNAWVRRVRDLISMHTADLGGIDNVSTAEQALIRRCATLITELERRELYFAQTAKIDDTALAVYQSGVNTLRRTLESLGLKRCAKEIGPTLGQLLREDQERQRERLNEQRESAAAFDLAPSERATRALGPNQQLDDAGGLSTVNKPVASDTS